MKKDHLFSPTVIIFILCTFVIPCHAQGTDNAAPVFECRIINQFPHDDKAYTQGLLYHDTFLYESTGKHGHSSLRKVDLQSGTILTEVKINKALFGEGICLWKGNIYQLTWYSEKGFIYNPDTLICRGTFKYKGQGWGLTSDGSFIIQSNGSDTLTFRDPHDFLRIKRLEVTDGNKKTYRLNELEYVKGLILCNIWHKDLIAAIHPLTGKVEYWLDISPLRHLSGEKAEVANGIAWDSKEERLFVTGKFWNKLFEIELPALKKTSSGL